MSGMEDRERRDKSSQTKQRGNDETQDEPDMPHGMRSNETQDQLPRPRARVAAKLKGVATLSGETSRARLAASPWLGVLGGIIIGVGPTTPATELKRDQLGELGRDVCHRLI